MAERRDEPGAGGGAGSGDRPAERVGGPGPRGAGGHGGGGSASGEAARRTPYEVAFRDPSFEAERFPAIREEAAARGVATWEPERFVMLSAVGEVLRELLPPEEAAAGGGGAAVAHVGRLLFQAYHFWRFGRRLLLVEEELARGLAESPPRVGPWEATPPHPAGYLQLPRHLFWARAVEDAPPEPVDGIFWTMVGEDDPAEPPHHRLDALLALGLRPGRPGFGVVAVEAVLPGPPAGHWADADARPDGRDFANVLPGGELEGLFSLVTEAEVLKLLSLLFWYAAEHPSALAPGRAAPAGMPSPHALPPSALPYECLRRVDADG